MTKRNNIVEMMPYTVTKSGLIEARFRSVSDAIDFRDLIAAKYPSVEWEVVFQFYNDHDCLMMHKWASP